MRKFKKKKKQLLIDLTHSLPWQSQDSTFQEQWKTVTGQGGGE